MPYKDKEKKKEWGRKYRQINKKKIDEHRKNNKDSHKLYMKEYRKTDVGKKKETLNGWNKLGIIFDNKEETEFYYEIYIKSTNCSWCGKEYKNSKCRHLDHHHLCGRPRAIICGSCNIKDIVPCVLCLNS